MRLFHMWGRAGNRDEWICSCGHKTTGDNGEREMETHWHDAHRKDMKVE